MAAKKNIAKKAATTPATTKTPSVVSVLEGPVYKDGFLHFSPNDLIRFELAQAKLANALQAIGLKKAEIEKFKNDVQNRSRCLESDLAQLVSISKGVEDSFVAFRAELEKKYELDFSRTSYDDASGRIHLLSADEGRK